MKKIINIRKRVICLGLCLGLIINQMMILHCNKVIAIETSDSDLLDFQYSTSDSLYDTFGQPDIEFKDLESSETWSKVDEHIYWDKNSVDAQNNGYVSGIFKQYFPSGKKKNGNYVAYKTINVATVCNKNDSKSQTKTLGHILYKYYDFNNTLITEDSIGKSWIDTQKIEHGDLYFQNLCMAYNAKYYTQNNNSNTALSIPKYNGYVQNTPVQSSDNTQVKAENLNNNVNYTPLPKKKKSFAERYKEKYGVSLGQALLFGAVAGLRAGQPTPEQAAINAINRRNQLLEREIQLKYMPRFTDIQMPQYQRPKTYQIYDGYGGIPRWTIREGY